MTDKHLFLVQSLPFDTWETLAYFDTQEEAKALRDRLTARAEANPSFVDNYRVYAVLDTPHHREQHCAYENGMRYSL